MTDEEISFFPKWVYPDENQKEWHREIVSEFNIHPATAQVLISRGFSSLEEINSFLYAKLPNLHDPKDLHDMDKAIARVQEALASHENILIYGDNDVDGMTGTALLVDFFHLLGLKPHYCVPNSATLQKSPLIDALDYATEHGCTLIITVDCGISAAEEIEELRKKKIDVIITDHHEPTDRLPHSIATLNPKLINSSYPNRELTGVGVAFKLAHGITNELVKTGAISSGKIDLKRFLDLVALGTVADMGAMMGENRILVKYGLRQFAHSKRVGISKLLDVCELKASTLTTADIASKLAPRLNSLGRIDDPQKGVDLLLIRDAEAAEILAQELDINNTERQSIERKDAEDLEKMLIKQPEILKEKAIILYSESWHPGIIPILSARIAKQYNRPTIIMAIEKGIAKGSLRTIPEFPILPALKKQAKYLLNFGGHDFAAGLTMEVRHIEAFKKAFLKEAAKQLKNEDILPKLHLDAPISFKELTFDFLESLQLLEPFGTENPPPILYANVTQAWPPKVVGKTHLKLYLEQDDRMLEGIGFGLAEQRPALCRKHLNLQIAFTPQVNNFLNKSSIQLLVKDVKLL